MLDITETFNNKDINDKLPILEEAPDYTNLKPLLVMPKLLPAPKIFEDLHNQSFIKEQTEDIAISTSHLPLKKRRQSLYFDYSSIDKVNAEKSHPEVTEPIKKFQPRIKVTQENFNRISSIGYCCHSSEDFSFRCYSEQCNFKVKTREKFLKHIQDHHKSDCVDQQYIFCHLCKASIPVRNLEEEF